MCGIVGLLGKPDLETLLRMNNTIIHYHLYLPNYLPGLSSFRLLLVGVYFNGLFLCFSSFFLTIGKPHHLIPFRLGAIALNFALDSLLLAAGYGIEGVALASATTSTLFGLSIVAYATSHYQRSLAEGLRFHFLVLMPIICAATSSVALERVVRALRGDAFSFAGLVLEVGLFLLIQSPILSFAVLRLRVLEFLKR